MNLLFTGYTFEEIKLTAFYFELALAKQIIS